MGTYSRDNFCIAAKVLLGWGIVMLSAGYAPATTINFDTLADGTPLAEGVISGDEYADMGVFFSIADTSFPPGSLIIDNSSGCSSFAGMTEPNTLAVTAYSPGPSCSLGCNADIKVNFTAPVTQADILVFSSIPDGVPVQLIARDAAGAIVDQDEFLGDGGAWDTFTFSVSSPKPNISSIETYGATGHEACLSFDNLSFVARKTCPACPAINSLLL